MLVLFTRFTCIDQDTESSDIHMITLRCWRGVPGIRVCSGSAAAAGWPQHCWGSAGRTGQPPGLRKACLKMNLDPLNRVSQAPGSISVSKVISKARRYSNISTRQGGPRRRCCAAGKTTFYLYYQATCKQLNIRPCGPLRRRLVEVLTGALHCSGALSRVVTTRSRQTCTLVLQSASTTWCRPVTGLPETTCWGENVLPVTAARYEQYLQGLNAAQGSALSSKASPFMTVETSVQVKNAIICYIPAQGAPGLGAARTT